MGLTLFHEIFLTFVLYVIYPKLMVWDQTHGFMCFTLWKPLINMCVPFVPFARVMEKRVKLKWSQDMITNIVLDVVDSIKPRID
jgi:hypothetical protein